MFKRFVIKSLTKGLIKGTCAIGKAIFITTWLITESVGIAICFISSTIDSVRSASN